MTFVLLLDGEGVTVTIDRFAPLKEGRVAQEDVLPGQLLIECIVSGSWIRCPFKHAYLQNFTFLYVFAHISQKFHQTSCLQVLKVVLAWWKVKTPCHANGVFINKC